MRIIIHGVGAIGGVVGAALVEAGHEVLGIARGRMLEAIRERGLDDDLAQGPRHRRAALASHIPPRSRSAPMTWCCSA